MTAVAARVCAGLLLWLAATAAFAHASLMEPQPADGARLAQAPAELRLRFNETVAPLRLQLVQPDGATVPIAPVETDALGLRAHLPPVAATGTYLLSWRVVSADGHPVGGSLSWSVGAPSATAPQAASASAPLALRLAIWASRLALYALLFLGIGAVLFRSVIAARSVPPRWTAPALLAGLLLVPLNVGLLGLDALSADWPALATAAPWQAALDTRYGLSAALLMLALLAALAGLARHRAVARATSLLAVALLGIALAASGHASTAPPRWLARPAVFVHALAITAWIGSLLPLARALRGREGAAVLQAFSRVIPWVVAALIASGATLVLLQLDTPRALWSTDYGRLLGAKLAVVALLLGIAAFNRRVLTERIRRGQAQAGVAMRRLIVVEVGLALVVLALAAGWRFTPPPRALAAAATPHVVYAHLHGERAMVDLVLSAQADGRLAAHLDVLMPGDPPEAKEVSIELSRPDSGIEPLQRSASRQPDGSWQVEPLALPAGGRWHVRVDVLVSDFEQARLEGDIEIP